MNADQTVKAPVTWQERALANWLSIAAGLSIVVTLGLALADKAASAGITAGFTVALVFLHHLPDLDSLKGWGVEAKMRAQKVEQDLARAEEILQRIDSIASSLSSSTLMFLLHVGRLGSPSWEDCRKIISRIRELHREGIPQTARDAESRIFEFIAYDLRRIMERVMRERLAATRSDDPNSVDDKSELAFAEKPELHLGLQRFINSFTLSESDKANFEKLAFKLNASYQNACDLKSVEVDPSRVVNAELYKETFGEDPNSRYV